MVELLGQLAVGFDVDPSRVELRPHIDLSAEELQFAEEVWRGSRSPRMLVNVSSGTAARRWPEDRFVNAVTAARRLAPELEIVVIGSPDERERAERVAHALDARYVGTKGIRDAFALVATATLVFTPDTSIGHATSAFEKPGVVMFVRGAAARWAPYRTPVHVIEWTEPTLDRLPLEPVREALEAQVAAHATRGRAATA